LPVLAFFLAVGTVLLGLLMWAGETLPPMPDVIPVSQQVGIPEPFKAEDLPAAKVATQPVQSSPAPPPTQKPAQVASAPESSQAAAHPKRKKAHRRVAEEPGRHRLPMYSHLDFARPYYPY
jgi:hypothetical protein